MLRFEPLSDRHDVSGFASGATFLDDYLKNDALEEMRHDRARTTVCLEIPDDGNETVIGFFTLKTMIGQYVPALRDDIPEEYLYPIELAYLARTTSRHGQGIGGVLLLEALRHVLQASAWLGFPGVALTATAEGAGLYERFGFLRLGPNRREMYLPLQDARLIVAAAEADDLR